MNVMKKSIPRRTVLRGLGATVALPLLDGMVPALTATRLTAANTPRRFGVVYVPNGMTMRSWTPANIVKDVTEKTERALADEKHAKYASTPLELSPILQPLEAFRERLVVLRGLSNKIPDGLFGGHACSSTRFLTDVYPKPGQGSEILAGVSLDQVIAKQHGQDTALASLELSLESSDSAGSCDIGFSCAYTNTLSWRTPTTPLPTENNPRTLFERLFGDGGTTDPAARKLRTGKDRSLLDSVTEKVARFRTSIGARDRVKLNEYLDAVRDVERRLQKAEQQHAQLPIIDQPAGIPQTVEEHAKLMYDLQVLAYQTEMTRVITFMIGRELTGRPYPEIGISEGHHPLSHHQEDPERLVKLTEINTFHTRLFAYYLDKLRSTPDGDGSLLDHVVLIYGAGMSNSHPHAQTNLPLLLVGGSEGGRHITVPDGTPLANLHVTVANRLGVPIETIGDSTGALDL